MPINSFVHKSLDPNDSNNNNNNKLLVCCLYLPYIAAVFTHPPLLLLFFIIDISWYIIYTDCLIDNNAGSSDASV